MGVQRVFVGFATGLYGFVHGLLWCLELRLRFECVKTYGFGIRFQGLGFRAWSALRFKARAWCFRCFRGGITSLKSGVRLLVHGWYMPRDSMPLGGLDSKPLNL